MKFRDFAWGAFIFKTGYDDNSIYQPLASDNNFLARLKTTSSLEDLENLREFLVHYGVRHAPKNLAEQYLKIWPRLQPHIQRLSDERLEICNFDNPQIQNEIRAAYNLLLLGAWGGDTTVSKILHFCNTSFFVMWDINIRTGKFGPQGYIEFLQAMQREAVQVLEDFKRLGLPGRPEEFLSKALKYTSIRPLTKLIDDHNWVTITKGWPATPPDWLLGLLIRK
jgi:hypothetical protein